MSGILEALSDSERSMFAGLVSIRDACGIAQPRCKGFDIGDGNYSGCAIGDGEDPKKFGDDVCPACNNTGVAKD